MSRVMQLENKYVHLRRAVARNEHIDGWRVCWLGGWDRQRVFFVVMFGAGHGQAAWPPPRVPVANRRVHDWGGTHVGLPRRSPENI